jgi:hypothetical protein
VYVRLIKPTTASNYRSLAFLCAIGAVWSLWDFYQAFHSLPILQGTGPLLQGYGTENYSQYTFEVKDLVTTYGFSQIPDHYPTPVLVIYLRIALHFCFWTVTSFLLGKYSSQPDRINDAYRLIGTLAVGLVIIDETVRLQVRGEAYRHLYVANSFGTAGQTVGTVVICAILLLLLIPWPRLFQVGRYKSKILAP